MRDHPAEQLMRRPRRAIALQPVVAVGRVRLDRCEGWSSLSSTRFMPGASPRAQQHSARRTRTFQPMELQPCPRGLETWLMFLGVTRTMLRWGTPSVCERLLVNMFKGSCS